MHRRSWRRCGVCTLALSPPQPLLGMVNARKPCGRAFTSAKHSGQNRHNLRRLELSIRQQFLSLRSKCRHVPSERRRSRNGVPPSVRPVLRKLNPAQFDNCAHSAKAISLTILASATASRNSAMISSTEQYGLRGAGPLKPIRITPNRVTHPLKRQSVVIAGGPYLDIDSGRNSYANASPIEPLNRTAPFNVEE